MVEYTIISFLEDVIHHKMMYNITVGQSVQLFTYYFASVALDHSFGQWDFVKKNNNIIVSLHCNKTSYQ